MKIFRAPYKIIRRGLLYCMSYYDGPLAGISKINNQYVYWRLTDPDRSDKCMVLLLDWNDDCDKWLEDCRINVYWWWYENGKRSKFFDTNIHVEDMSKLWPQTPIQGQLEEVNYFLNNLTENNKVL